MTDEEILEALKEIDVSARIDCTEWEGEFLQSILYDHIDPLTKKRKYPLTPRQRESAEKMIEKYEERL